MEASLVPVQRGPPSAEHYTSKASTEPEIPSKPQDVGLPSKRQEHNKEPSAEKFVNMDIPPHTSLIQNHHKEIPPAEPDNDKPVPELNLMNTSPLYHALPEPHKETSIKKNLTETSSENNAPKFSATQDGHQKELSSAKGAVDTPLEHHNKQEHRQEPATNKLSSEHTPTVKGFPAAIPETGGQHARDSVEARDKTAQEVKLTSMHDPKVEHREIKQFPPPLEQQHAAKSMEQSVSVSVRHSADNSAHSSSVQHQAEPTIGLTMQGDVEPLPEKHHNTETLEASSTLSQPESEIQEQIVVVKQPLITTFLSEAHQNLTEEHATKNTQNITLRSAQKPTRAEIDTAAPFESVKAAVSLFGERMDWKSQVRPPQASHGERRVLPESELHKAQDDLFQYKDQLALTQASTAGVLLELKKVKRLIQNPASKVRDTDILSQKSLEAADTSKNRGAASLDKPNNELVTIMREVESVKEELISTTASKEATVKGLQDALSSLNTILKRVDELAAEKSSLDDAVADAHIALADAEEQVDLLKSGQKVESLNSMPSDFMEKKSAEIRGLETKLEEARAMIANLKEDLLATKKAEGLAVVEIQQRMALEKLELDKAKSVELSIVGKLATVLEESDELKAKLEKMMQENTTLSSTIDALKLDIERYRKELESMHEKEQNACATLASLQDELQKVKVALRAAEGGTARALEAKNTLPAAIKQAASEADEAKAAAETAKEEARRARQEIEQAKAAASTAASRQQAALKELEAAKASEAMALAELKALTETESQSADMESEADGVMGVTISLQEYSALKQAAVEAEGLADKKVAEVIAQVEEAKASQERAQLKLEEVAKEAEKGREDLNKAQKQANDAQEAKLTAEAGLRKWRAEHDQRRKSGGGPLDPKAGTMKHPPLKNSEDEKLIKFGSYEKEDMITTVVQGEKIVGRDSLAQVMSLEVPTPQSLERVLTAEKSTEEKVKVKKRNLIRRLSAMVALKKKA